MYGPDIYTIIANNVDILSTADNPKSAWAMILDNFLQLPANMTKSVMKSHFDSYKISYRLWIDPDMTPQKFKHYLTFAQFRDIINQRSST